MSDNQFDPSRWHPVEGFDDLTYHRHVADSQPQQTVRVAIGRPN